jgi:hypothetical protein
MMSMCEPLVMVVAIWWISAILRVDIGWLEVPDGYYVYRRWEEDNQ